MSDTDFRILGTLEVTKAGRSVDLGPAKRRTVLAVLLVYPNEVVSTGRLIESVWDDSPPPSASNTLQGYVSHLRRTLGADRIKSGPSGYQLCLAEGELDADRFERLVVEAREATQRHDPAPAVHRLEEALRLWRGPAFVEFAHQGFAQAEAARLDELRSVAVEELADLQLAMGLHHELVGPLQTLVREQPLRERRWSQLAIALYRAGRQGEALRVCAEMRSHLREELGIEPSPGLRRLEEDILLQRSELEWSPSTSAGGAENVRDRLPRPLDNLPRPRSTFVGREPELAELGQLVAVSAVVTVVGTGGAGKTRVAVEAASRLREKFPDGVCLVEFASLADSSEVLPTVATALDLADDRGESLLNGIVDALTQRHLLVVFDNCEHVIRAVAALVDALLATCPHLAILATSREPLRVEGEMVWRIPPLATPPDGTPPDEVTRFDAVTLFFERACARGPFRIDSANAPAVAALCRHLDGLPLALELAAARATTFTPRELVARIDRRFALLTGGRRTAPARQQTLRAAVEWSYELLNQSEKTLFRRLSVFAGVFSMDAVEAVGAGEPIGVEAVADLVASLVDKSLVVAEEADGDTRFSLLETLRVYAAERLAEAGERELVQRRHLDWYRKEAEGAPAFVGAVDEHASDPGNELRDNLRVAFDWALESGDVASAVSLADDCGFAYVGAKRGLVERVVDASASAGLSVRAHALLLHATASRETGDHVMAAAARREALQIFEDLGEHEGVAASLHYLAASATLRGEYESALRMYERCLEEWREAGVDRAYGTALNFVLHNLGIIALRTGDVATARSRLEEALALARSLGQEGGVAVHLHHLGEIDEAVGRNDAAYGRYAESARLARALGFDRSLSASLAGLARVALRAGDVQGAARSAVEALELAAGDADHVWSLPAIVAVASVATARGAMLAAARLLGAVAACQEANGRDLPVVERAVFQEAEARSRTVLGDEAYEAAAREGSEYTAMQAAELARAVAGEVAAAQNC